MAFIEWPKFIEPLIPARHLEISLRRISDQEREIEVVDNTESYKSLLEALGAK